MTNTDLLSKASFIKDLKDNPRMNFETRLSFEEDPRWDSFIGTKIFSIETGVLLGTVTELYDDFQILTDTGIQMELLCCVFQDNKIKHTEDFSF